MQGSHRVLALLIWQTDGPPYLTCFIRLLSLPLVVINPPPLLRQARVLVDRDLLVLVLIERNLIIHRSVEEELAGLAASILL